jgi:hypothetical protein
MEDINGRAAEALEQAADAFESGELRWVQHTLGSRQYGTACARGGLLRALTGNQRGVNLVDGRHALSKAEQAMGFASEFGYRPWTLPTWNDSSGRTVQDVIDRMKEGAKRLRNGELA